MESSLPDGTAPLQASLAVSRVAQCYAAGLISPPVWLVENLQAEVVAGSQSYGCARPEDSDLDIVGITIPPVEVVFPHLTGYIPGFGPKPPEFEQFQSHHVIPAHTKAKYDFAIYGMVKFFDLCMAANPNMVDYLFAPDRCVPYQTAVWDHLSQHRQQFLHKGAWSRFRGYAVSQIRKLEAGRDRKNPVRQASIDTFGYDTKYAYHIVRLALECEQILATGNLILDRDAALYREIRAGEWSLSQVRSWFDRKVSELEVLYETSLLPAGPDVESIRRLLLECLEMHWGYLPDFALKPLPLRR